MELNPNKVGVVLAAAMGAFHAGWALLVALGVAQPLIDFILKLHFINPVYVIQPFNLATALGLIVFTSAVGYATGLVYALLWNKFHK